MKNEYFQTVTLDNIILFEGFYNCKYETLILIIPSNILELNTYLPLMAEFFKNKINALTINISIPFLKNYAEYDILRYLMDQIKTSIPNVRYSTIHLLGHSYGCYISFKYLERYNFDGKIFFLAPLLKKNSTNSKFPFLLMSEVLIKFLIKKQIKLSKYNFVRRFLKNDCTAIKEFFYQRQIPIIRKDILKRTSIKYENIPSQKIIAYFFKYDKAISIKKSKILINQIENSSEIEFNLLKLNGNHFYPLASPNAFILESKIKDIINDTKEFQ